MPILVVKKDGSTESWDTNKIITAANKAADRANVTLDVYAFKQAIDTMLSDLFTDGDLKITTTELHPIVIEILRHVNEKAADAYQEFRDYKNTYAKEFEKIKGLADNVLLLGDRENANFDSSLVSTKGSLIKGYLTKSLYTQFYLSNKEKELIKRGDIYIHDLRDMLLNSFNCCLFDMGNVLKGGFTMSNIKYTEPKSVLTALQVIGDITLVATAQQFGGFTIPEIDKVLVPYCEKTYWSTRNKAITEYGLSTEAADKLAMDTVRRELEQGFQALELKLNTVPCSRGDFAFTTITFGHSPYTEKDDICKQQFLYMVGEAILKTRMKGHGGKQVVFPKLVYLYDENQYNTNPYSKKLFELAVECSSKCMYPDYLSLTGNIANNAVAQVYEWSGHKAITSPMGCRAFLSPWKDPETGKYVTTGRCNIGAVSLNLPLIIARAKQDKDYLPEYYGDTAWKAHFWELLDEDLEAIRSFFKKRYEILGNTKACTNPMCFMEGGLYKGNLKADDTIKSLLPYMTASFGITALNEASILWNGKPLAKDNSFAIKVLKYINNYIARIKQDDGYLYALYGTPAESLCSTQAKQYADFTGDDQFGEYFSNSFHCHVSEHITPAEKQDLECDAFHMCNGGHIQYVRIDNPENTLALKAIILRGMRRGFYQGVNFDAAYCENCGKHSTNVMNKCPYCGSTNLTVISRVCGYLGYSNINGNSRMNDGKMAEIKDRVSM